MKYNFYFFDFDYTLVNSEQGIVGCFIKTMEQLHIPPNPWDEIKKTIGMPMMDAISLLTGLTSENEKMNFLNIYKMYAAEMMTDNTHFYPDTIKVLEKIKAAGCTTAIISTKTRHRITEKFERSHCENLIDLIIGNEDTTTNKPDPQGINLAMRLTGANKREVLYIGDSLFDAGAAKNAGVDFAAVLTGNTTKQEFLNYPHVQLMETLSELL
ncbi:MAG: HAD-IA family hydrolase [Anaerovibrio sp.]|uniref:HAD family hydrolase n=1 Tax=Anaerovibrio sp. TaxID=1872532 RepID=UPI0025CC81CA|nr:HAD-IA family hydrolase [Anaerovibrio sp.]MCR5177097.1 HAD-IA family hydrolase [Anaerovibrio sp.]